MSASNSLEAAVGQALFLGQPFPHITQWQIHLYTTLPNESDAGGVDLAGGATGYTPIRHDPGADRWRQEPTQDAQNRTVFSNSVAVLSAVANSNWSGIAGYGLRDQTGVLRYVVPFAGSVSVTAGHRLSFGVGQLSFPIG